MKKFLITIIFLLSCIGVFSQTVIPPASTWTPARNIINANFSDTYDSIAANRLRVNILNDSILAYATAINLRLLKSDTASMLGNYTRNGELNAALAFKLSISDTATMLEPYALTSELGDAGTSIGDVRDEIADSLNVLRPLYVAVADTASMLDPYAKLSDLSEGGISIGAVQDEIADSLNVLRPLVVMIADSLTAYVTPSQLSDSLSAFEGGGGVTLETVQGEISDSLDARIGAGIELSDVAVMIADSTGNAPGNYVTRKALNDSINANLGGAVGITLNSGTITLNGDGGTADDITFYTNGNGSYNLPTGGGNLTIMSEVQGWINDSLDVIRPLYLEIADTTSMLANYALLSEVGGGDVTLSDVQNVIADSLNAIRSASVAGIALADSTGYAPGNYVTHTQLDAFSGGSFDTTYLHYRIDSLIIVVENQATEIENLWNAIETLGNFDLTAPAFLSAELGSFADDTLVVLMDTTDVRQDSVPPLTAFTLWAGATEHGIASVDIGHDTLYIALDSAGVYGATYTLDYTRGTPALQDSSGNKTSSWIGRSVTNNIAQPSEEPSFLASDGNTDFRYVAESQYITMATGVSQWQDISGSGWHLAQATGTAQPAFSEATGVSFDGTSDFLRNNSVAVSAPWTVYIVANITYVKYSTFLYFNEVGSDRIYSMMPDEVNPTMELGSIAQNYVTNTWYVWTITMDGANSSIQLNDGTPTVASYTNAAIDLLSFASFEGTNWGNLRIKEVIGRAGADTAPNKSAVITYLMNKYAIE